MTVYQTPPPDYAPEVTVPPEGAYIRPGWGSSWSRRPYFREDFSGVFMLIIGFILGAAVINGGWVPSLDSTPPPIQTLASNVNSATSTPSKPVSTPSSVVVSSTPTATPATAAPPITLKPAPVYVTTVGSSLIKPDHTEVLVRNGDSLSQIADREYHHTSRKVEVAILAANQLVSSDRVRAGQILKLPTIAN